MTRQDAFRYFGVTLRNGRNAWSGRNEERKKVAVTVWPNYFDESGKEPTYRFAARTPLGEYRNGRKWLIEDLQYARDHCDGYLHVVWCEAKDSTVRPWQIDRKKTKPHQWMLLKLEDLDAVTAEFTAKVIRLRATPVPHDDDESLEYCEAAVARCDAAESHPHETMQ
jgi:hypothetical protein